jgi:hypothetical protein
MGLLIGVGTTKPKFPYDYYYGVQWDTTVASSALTRLGKPELHVTLPVQSRMRRCILNDLGQVVYYLHPQDSTLQDNSAPADLTGASGQVMVEIPEHYRKFEMEGTKCRVLLSLFALPGFLKVDKMYISAYEAALNRTNNKLASVVNTTADYRGGSNNAAYDAASNTLLGRPATNISLTNFRAYARNRGSVSWNCNTYEAQKTLYWLYTVEYADFNCQLTYNAAPTSEGYHQGGLGAGVTDLDSAKWNTFNAYNPFIPCGHTNSLGNVTGVVNYSMPAEYDATIKTVSVPSYRGIENLFGHVWKWTDGCKARIQSDASGAKSEFYVCTNPANFQSTDYSNYVLRGLLPRTSNYIKSFLLGEFGEILPLSVGGSATTYQCDYFYTDIPGTGEEQRGLFFGGSANVGLNAGLVCSSSSNSAASAHTAISSRLCFHPG